MLLYGNSASVSSGSRDDSGTGLWEVSGLQANSSKAEDLEKALLKALKRRNARVIVDAVNKQLAKGRRERCLICLKKLFLAAGIAWI